MSIAGRVSALMDGLSREDLQRLPPAARRRFADQCRFWAKIAVEADLRCSGEAELRSDQDGEPGRRRDGLPQERAPTAAGILGELAKGWRAE